MSFESDLIAKKPNKSGKSGRRYNALRLPGVDLRSEEGKRYARHFRALDREFPDAEAAELRDLATLKASLEHAQGAVLTETEIYRLAKAREDMLRLSRTIARRVAELRARHNPQPAVTTAADIAAQILAGRDDD